MDIKPIIEALLFAADKPLTIKHLQQIFPELERPEKAQILMAIAMIKDDYRRRPIELKELASGYRFQVKAQWSPWVSRLFVEKPPRYSRALLETLAVIAYRQPVTRGDIEDIRGVAASSTIIHTLLDREWVKIIGRKEVPGRPALYATTKQLLDYFNLSSLAELPNLMEVAETHKETKELIDSENQTTEKEPRTENSTETQANEAQSAADGNTSG